MKVNGFQFKQFFIAHDKCAMKVNTDGILLGAIANPQNATQILDLGTGTGLVAIMLAQRSQAQISAIEIEQDAFKQAVENAQNSAWSDRINVIHCDVLTFSSQTQFDLIVSNPPYFTYSLPSRNIQRDIARTAQNTTHFQWLSIASLHITDTGKITFILPFESAQQLIQQSLLLSLYCIEQWQIRTTPNKIAKRAIVTFSKQPAQCKKFELTIYDEKNQYTADFKHLTQSFYLNF